MIAQLAEGREIEFEDSPIAQGGEKVVFLSRDRQYVVSFFFNTLSDRNERCKRLEKILRDYNVTKGQRGEYWRKHFYWPTDLLDGSIRPLPKPFLTRNRLVDPALAVVVPVYARNFYFLDTRGQQREKDAHWFVGEKARKMVPEEEFGTLQTCLRLCAKMARAVRRMHFAGLAHSDLSNKNVLIDPRHGDACLSDIDSLVVPHTAPPAVKGTPGYIAPEVLANDGLPCIATDCYALAVLIYEILLLRHPLKGPKIHSDDPQIDEHLQMGPRAVFVENPGDRTNCLMPKPKVPLDCLGPYISKLCFKTFVEGLHNPGKRASASEWESALYKTADFLHPSPDGLNWFVLAPGMPKHCPFTGKALLQPIPFAKIFSETGPSEFRDQKHSLTIYHHLSLMKWHTLSNYSPDESADRVPQGFFALHHGSWFLRNESGGPMQVRKGRLVPHGQSVEIEKGLELQVSGGPKGRLLSFDFM
jgi:serine/threonine protein kinase